MGCMRPIQTEPCGSARCGVCRTPTQQLRMRGWQGILRLLSIDRIRGYRVEEQRTSPKPESLPNRLRVLRSIPTDDSGSTHDCYGTAAGYPVTPPVLYGIAVCAWAEPGRQRRKYAARHRFTNDANYLTRSRFG